MNITYVTFGQVHRHEINGTVFDKDCVAVIECKNAVHGRERALELFGIKFCFTYYNCEFNMDSLQHYPRGLLRVQKPVKPLSVRVGTQARCGDCGKRHPVMRGLTVNPDGSRTPSNTLTYFKCPKSGKRYLETVNGTPIAKARREGTVVFYEENKDEDEESCTKTDNTGEM